MQFRIVAPTQGGWTFYTRRRGTVAIVRNAQLLIETLARHNCQLVCRMGTNNLTTIRHSEQLRTLYYIGRGIGNLRIAHNTGRILGVLIPSQDDMSIADEVVDDSFLRVA